MYSYAARRSDCTRGKLEILAANIKGTLCTAGSADLILASMHVVRLTGWNCISSAPEAAWAWIITSCDVTAPCQDNCSGYAKCEWDIEYRWAITGCWSGAGHIDDHVSNIVIAQLLFLQSENSKKDISLYINSPGGSASATLAMIDTMNHIKPDVSTVCVGLAASGGAWLLSAGAKGKRYALPNAEIMIHQPLGGAEGQASDIEIRAKQILRLRETLAKMMAKNTGQSLVQVQKDIDRDFFMNAEEAKKYGIIDKIL